MGLPDICNLVSGFILVTKHYSYHEYDVYDVYEVYGVYERRTSNFIDNSYKLPYKDERNHLGKAWSDGTICLRTVRIARQDGELISV